MIFKPIGNRVLVKRDNNETKTNSGIYLSSGTSKEKNCIGIVLEVSDTFENKDIAKGKKIAFKEYKAIDLKLENNDYLIIELEDILGILE